MKMKRKSWRRYRNYLNLRIIVAIRGFRIVLIVGITILSVRSRVMVLSCRKRGSNSLFSCWSWVKKIVVLPSRWEELLLRR